MREQRKDDPNLKHLTGAVFDAAESGKVREYRRRWRENPEGSIVERFPIHLDIESTSVCNLRCTFCAGTYEKYPQGTMDMGLYRRIIDEGSAAGLCSIKLNFRGEPLLHPHIVEMVAYAKGKGILDVFFNTNATRLTEEVGRGLIEAGLDRLIVSFEGYTKEVYEANRVGAVFERTVDNVRRFVELKRAMGSRTPALRLQTVAVPCQEGQADYLETYKTFWRDVADEITCIDLRDETADYTGLASSAWKCPYPWRRLCVTWDGIVYTCPFVNRSPEKYGTDGVGNVTRDSIESIWRGPRMEEIRRSHLAGQAHLIEPCTYCSYRGTELLKDMGEDPA